MSSNRDLLRLGGLWINKDRNGKQYLAGRLSSDVRILIFKNEFRTEEKQPSHIMYLAPVERAEDAGRAERADDDFLADELSVETPAAPPPAAAPRASGAARPPAARPANPPRRPAPTRDAPDDIDTLDDPFAE